MSPRIKPSFQHDSKNWTFSGMWLKELNLLNTTQRIEPFFFKKKKEPKELNLSGMWLKELSLFFFPNVTHRIEPLFMTQRIEPFFLKTTQKYDSKNWTFFQYDSKILFNTTQRIEHFFFWIRLKNSNFKKNSKNWTFWTWLKELNLLKYDSKNWF